MPNRRVIFIVMAYTLALILFASNVKAGGVHGCTNCFAGTIEPSNLPHGWTCQDVRDAVKIHGKVVAYARAKLHGLTDQQIKEIRQRCKV